MQTKLERQRRQNRDRQRAWRERKRAAAETQQVMTTNVHWQGHGMLIAAIEDDSMTTKFKSRELASLSPKYSTSHEKSESTSRGRNKLISPLLPYTTDSSLNLLAPTIEFPLSPDHCLITLVQFNIVQAMIYNMSILSLLYCLPTTCSASFGVPILDTILSGKIPTNLKPTPLQESAPHPFWISAIPVAAMRDNLILLAGTYDCNDLCYDLGQALYEGFDDVERRGCLVWGDSWDVNSWEVTEGFVRKWGFLLKGCQNLIESTNYWRELRGEDRLIVEI